MKYIILASIAGRFAGRLKRAQVDKELPHKALFLTTAANPYQEKPWLEEDIKLFSNAGMELERVDFAKLAPADIISLLDSTSTLIVGGGNPIYLLEVLKEKEILSHMRKRVEEGMIYVGSSAGAVLASDEISLETIHEDREGVTPLDSYRALDLIGFQVLPHWGDDNFKDEYLQMVAKAYTQNKQVVSLTDWQAVEINEDKLTFIDTKKNARSEE